MARAPDTRIITENEWAVALTPFASMHPFEVWIAPKEHLAAYDQVPDAVLDGAAEVFQRAVAALEKAIGGQAYNIVLHHDRDESFHFRFVMFARIFTYSGFVLGTGTSINGLDPERAAAALKEV
jgi:UDPglucose--hexose-1-phosphate uridylyltransferase